MLHRRRILLLALLCFLLLPWGTAPAAPPANKTTGDPHSADKAVAALDVGQGMVASLFASEPMMLNPTNIDIDERGRVWVCEVVNYRHNNGRRPEGDRILILEDTNGDGLADKETVFYQGRDIDSALGICVLGNRVIVSCSPNVFVFTNDGHDKVARKELLFTKTGTPQHDHSAHAFVFGPDGRYYWNFGNYGHAVHDKDGKQVVDLEGNPVVENGKPYRGGMIFRCDADGGNFEVLAHNFRNNYEVAVDSFGSLWQSDNDDDGNRAVRINYILEHGNYGYTGELDGTAWQTPRTNIEAGIPRRHWHQNDPGVVPNLLLTGAGAPCGILVYEGGLLPPVFRNQMIHADAGPSVVRAYPVTPDGAGYKATMENILQGARDNWFRPADVCVAPDGSLIVADWYDPGVGGHHQGDEDHGRLFRVSVPGHERYVVPKFDFNTPDGAAAALMNSNQDVRYLAWTSLAAMGVKAEPALSKLWHNENPRFRARALWLLARLPNSGRNYIDEALKDKDSDIRITGLRAARQIKLPLVPILQGLVDDPSPAVRRECALALRHCKEEAAAGLWARLVKQHDGQDRWYLEALGIGADGQWDRYLQGIVSSLEKPGSYKAEAARDIVWRSRGEKTPGLLAATILDPKTPNEDLPRLLRAFDFQGGGDKERALLSLVAAKSHDDPAREQWIAFEAIKRLNPAEVLGDPRRAAVLNAMLDGAKGSSQYVAIVDRFNLKDRFGELLALAQKNPHEQVGVDAIRALLEKNELARIAQALNGKDDAAALATAAVLGTAADARATELLAAVVRSEERSLPLRREAARAIAKNHAGAQLLLKLCSEGKLDPQIKDAIAVPLCTAAWTDVKKQAAALFPPPAAGQGPPLPSIQDLVKLSGNATQGHQVFISRGTCVNCHRVGSEGKEIGPALSEIGDKLARPAMYESILYPNAGISNGFECYQLLTKGGTSTNGLLVEQTPDVVRIKNSEGIVLSFKPADIDELKKLDVSLMPSDLQKNMSTQDLADLVAYLATLKKPK